MKRQSQTREYSQGHLTSQMYTHSRNDSIANSQQKKPSRRASCSNLANFLNIDQLIEDVKITQLQQNKYTVHIQNIMRELQSLKGLPHIRHQVSTIELLLDTISRKVTSDSICTSRAKKIQTTAKKPTPRKNGYHEEQNSPIRDISDGTSIVYTNFSLKQMENLSHKNSIMSFDGCSDLQTPKKSIIYEEESNREMQKLNNQISILQKLLKNKGLEDALQPHIITNKKDINIMNVNDSSNKLQTYKHSESLCPPFRKKLIQKCKWNNSKENMGESSREGKIKVTQSKFR